MKSWLKYLNLISKIFIGMGFLALILAGIFLAQGSNGGAQKLGLGWLTLAVSSYLIGRMAGFWNRLSQRKKSPTAD